MFEWHDISTAPRDGTEFLAIGELGAMVIASFQLDPTQEQSRSHRKRVFVESFRGEVLYDPTAWATHWMPLPDPPKAQP